eukprot:gb/GFBE01078707.1/.p1 GENE.gb/GFBE01078707.1/~~gb/GFBE01078707.1/.p1  ORF type:complete len:341 (+),score=83.18 gb/GFBE01078707.1/:1-1023(+)
MSNLRSASSSTGSTTGASEWCEVSTRRRGKAEATLDVDNLLKRSDAQERNARRARRRAAKAAPDEGASCGREPLQELSRQNSGVSEEWFAVSKGARAEVKKPIPGAPTAAQLRNARRAKQRAEERARRCSQEVLCGDVQDCSRASDAPAVANEEAPTTVADDSSRDAPAAASEDSEKEAVSEEAHSPSDSLSYLLHQHDEVPASHDEREEDAAVAPRKHLARCQKPWNGQQSGFDVAEGCMVRVWTDHATSNGWIFAEELADAARQGWLPVSILQSLEPGQEWRKVVRSCVLTMLPSQLAVIEGTFALVDLESQTAEGWIHATDEEGRTGWVPVACFEDL